MPVDITVISTTPPVLLVVATGKLEEPDYHTFAPEVESLINEHGRIRVLVQLVDFHGWTAGALWEDIKFDVKHFRDIERLAIVGDKSWEKGMAMFCKPFTTAEVRYYPAEQVEAARQWLRSARLRDSAAASK